MDDLYLPQFSMGMKCLASSILRIKLCSRFDSASFVAHQVVAFVKGTRSQPQCGFSFKMLQLLNESKADYEVVNVLDDVYNPGLRDIIKTYSQWPTIPQVILIMQESNLTKIKQHIQSKLISLSFHFSCM
jgi:glutaredoxin-related protein